MVFPLGKPFSPPPDELEHKIAKLMLAPGDARDRLTAGIYIPPAKDEPLNILEQALERAVSCEATEAKLRTAIKSGQIPAQEEESIEVALKQRIITSTELEILKKMGDLRRRVIMVDDFPSDFGSRPDKTTEAASPTNA